MARATWDAMYDQLTPYYGGVPLWRSTQDMLDAFWLSNGFADIPEGDVLLAFYQSKGAVGTALADVENDYWDRLGPAVLKDLGAVFALDARNSKVNEQWALNMGSGGQALRAKYGSVARAEIRKGVGLVNPGGTAQNYASIPDAANLDITDDLDIMVRFEADNVSHTGDLVSKWQSGNLNFAFRWESGLVTLYCSTDNTTWFGVSIAHGMTGPGWLRATRVRSTGLVTIYKAADSVSIPSSWTTLTSSVQSTAALSVGTAALAFGAQPLATIPFAGVIKRAIVANNGVTVADVDFTAQSDFTTSFTCATGQTVTVTAANAVDTNDPLFLPWNGKNYLRCPIVNGNAAVLGDLAEVRAATASFDIYARIQKPAVAAGQQQILSKWPGFGLLLNVANRFSLSTYDGGAEVTTASTVAWPVADYVDHWIKVTFVANNGSNRVATWSWAPDSESIPTSWNLVETTTLATTSIVHSGATLSVGALLGSSQNYDAPIYRVAFANVTGGPIVLDVDFTKNTNQSSFIASTGQTVTINRATSGRKTVVVTRPCWLFGTDDYMEVADNDLIDFNATDSFTLLMVSRFWATPTSQMQYLQKYANPSGVNGYGLQNNTTNTINFSYHNDGTVTSLTSGGSYTLGNVTVHTNTVNRTSQLNTVYSNNVAGTSVTTASLGSLTSAAPLQIGKANTYLDGEVFAVAIFRRALTTNEIAQIVTAYGAS